MESAGQAKPKLTSLKGVQWNWVFVSFFFYLFFCYFPTLAIYVITGSEYTLFVYLLGFMVSGFLVGYMSSGYTIREPGIGAVLFVSFFFLTVVVSGTSSSLYVGWVIWMLLGFFLGVTGAWVGEQIQAKVDSGQKQKKGTQKERTS